MSEYPRYVCAGVSCDKGELCGFFREFREPVWQCKRGFGDNVVSRYGTFDERQFSELEIRMYILIKARIVSMEELKSCYTLDEALKLYALYSMDLDIERCRAEEMKGGTGRR